MDILNTIADYAKIRVAQDKKEISLEELKERCRSLPAFLCPPGEMFEAELKKPGVSFICEVKKASPSKGLISEDFPYIDIAKEYEAAGADCVSCLTEPKWFLGSDEIFKEVRSAITLPMIRKDFTIDEYQIYQARLMGANAVLLICSLLDPETVSHYLEICAELGLTAIVETHDETEIREAVSCGAHIIGVNNRNLRDFSVDLGNSGRLRALVPENIIFVAESGIKTPQDVKELAEIGVNAVLVGETLMRSGNISRTLHELRAGAA